MTPQPERTAAPDPLYTYAFTVSADAVDLNGHVNNVKYVQWMQDVAVHHFDAMGGNPDGEDPALPLGF
ncbi:MAG: hypothetical protein IPP94_12175 [Ignavibacteria bacterium]|nr:hypothetical protein [Ignavibacteria bacterium]